LTLLPKHRLIEPVTPVCTFDSFHSKRSGEYYRFSIDRPQSSKMILHDGNVIDDHNHTIDSDDDDDKNHNKDLNMDVKGYKGITTEKELKDLHHQYFKFINNRDLKKMKQNNINSHLFKKVWTKPEITELDYKPYHKCKTKLEDHPELIVKDSSTITAFGSTILALEGTSHNMNFVMDRNARNNNRTSSWTESSDISQHLLPLSDMHMELSRRTTETQHHQWPSLSSSSSSSRPTSAIQHSSRRNSGVVPVQHQLLSSFALSSSSTSSSTAVSPIKSEVSTSSTAVPRPRSAVPQSSSSPPQPLSSSSLNSSNLHKVKSRPRSAVPFTTNPIAESSESSFHSSSVDLHPYSSRPHSAAPSSTSPKAVETRKSISRRPQSSPNHTHMTVYHSSTALLSSHAQSSSSTTTIPVSIRPHSAAPQTSSAVISPYLIIPPRPKSAAPNMQQQISRSQSRPISTRRRKPKLNNFHTRY
jgi:hypothetical protein